MSKLGIACFAFLFAICGWALYSSVVDARRNSCVPGRQDSCRTVYDDPGTHVCTSRGVWPEYCRRLGDGKLEVK